MQKSTTEPPSYPQYYPLALELTVALEWMGSFIRAHPDGRLTWHSHIDDRGRQMITVSGQYKAAEQLIIKPLCRVELKQIGLLSNAWEDYKAHLGRVNRGAWLEKVMTR